MAYSEHTAYLEKGWTEESPPFDIEEEGVSSESEKVFGGWFPR